MEKINSELYFNGIIGLCENEEMKLTLIKLMQYTRSMERILFPEPEDPLVKEWINKGWIK